MGPEVPGNSRGLSSLQFRILILYFATCQLRKESAGKWRTAVTSDLSKRRVRKGHRMKPGIWNNRSWNTLCGLGTFPRTLPSIISFNFP